MEEILNVLMKLLKEGDVKVNDLNVKVERDANGDITLRYSAPKQNKLVEQIKADINGIDEDIFNEAAKKLQATNKAAFEVMASIEDGKADVAHLRDAYEVFKRCVVEVVEGRVKLLTNEVNRLFSKYLDCHNK